MRARTQGAERLLWRSFVLRSRTTLSPIHRNTRLLAGLALLCCSAGAWAQGAKPAKEAKEHRAYFIDASVVRLATLLPAPPTAGSATTKEELATLHRIEAARTPAQVAAAQADDAEQDIFSFRTVLGEGFRADLLPLTAALSAHVHNEEGVTSAETKKLLARPRPYQADKTLHPVCAVTEAPNSYPSGHTLSGYLLALTLADLLPEKKQQILDRADDYAHNRLVCGVHYPSDLDASRRAAYLVFGYMLATPRFAHDLDAARTELRAHPEFTSATK